MSADSYLNRTVLSPSANPQDLIPFSNIQASAIPSQVQIGTTNNNNLINNNNNLINNNNNFSPPPLTSASKSVTPKKLPWVAADKAKLEQAQEYVKIFRPKDDKGNEKLDTFKKGNTLKQSGIIKNLEKPANANFAYYPTLRLAGNENVIHDYFQLYGASTGINEIDVNALNQIANGSIPRYSRIAFDDPNAGQTLLTSAQTEVKLGTKLRGPSEEPRINIELLNQLFARGTARTAKPGKSKAGKTGGRATSPRNLPLIDRVRGAAVANGKTTADKYKYYNFDSKEGGNPRSGKGGKYKILPTQLPLSAVGTGSGVSKFMNQLNQWANNGTLTNQQYSGAFNAFVSAIDKSVPANAGDAAKAAKQQAYNTAVNALNRSKYTGRTATYA